MNGTYGTEKATYFGIEVEILIRLSQCTLVRYQQRDFVVETADLSSRQTFAKAA